MIIPHNRFLYGFIKWIILVILIIAISRCALILSNVVSAKQIAYYLIILTFTNIVSIVFVRYNIKGDIYLFRPIILIIAFMYITVLFGMLNYFVTRKYYDSYYTDIFRTATYYNYGIISFVFGCWFIQKLFTLLYTQESRDTYYIWELEKLKKFIIILFIISSTITVFSYIKIGYIPALGYLIGSGRIQLLDQIDFLSIKFLCINGIVVMLSGIYLMLKGKDLQVIIIIFLGSILLASTGARFDFIMPFLVILICYDKYKRRIKLYKGFLAFLLILVIAYLYNAYVRMEEAHIYMSRFERLFYYSFMEFRDCSFMIDKLSENGSYFHGQTLINIILPAFPRQIWDLIGIDKINLMRSLSSAHVAAVMLYNNENVGIRVGLIGELFLNFGLTGILVGMFIFGMLIGFLDLKLLKASSDSSGVLFVNFLSVNLMIMIIGQLDGVFTTIYNNIYILLPLWFFARRHIHRYSPTTN